MDALIQLVESLGFPIVCCAALFHQQNRTMKDFNEKMEASIKVLSDNVVQNTVAINTLVTMVTTYVKKGDEIDV